MPGLPGAACTSLTAASLLSARTIACSRPPPPITSARTLGQLTREVAACRYLPSEKSDQAIDLDRLVAAGADADGADSGAGDLLERADVGLRGAGQVLEGLGPRDVLRPAVQVVVDRPGVVELGLRHRDVVVALAVDLVGHADR